MGLDRFGLEPGCRADLVLVPAESPGDALMRRAPLVPRAEARPHRRWSATPGWVGSRQSSHVGNLSRRETTCSFPSASDPTSTRRRVRRSLFHSRTRSVADAVPDVSPFFEAASRSPLRMLILYATAVSAFSSSREADTDAVGAGRSPELLCSHSRDCDRRSRVVEVDDAVPGLTERPRCEVVATHDGCERAFPSELRVRPRSLDEPPVSLQVRVQVGLQDPLARRDAAAAVTELNCRVPWTNPRCPATRRSTAYPEEQNGVEALKDPSFRNRRRTSRRVSPDCEIRR